MIKPCGFSLVELVIVILILGVLTAAAVPKLFGSSTAATDNGLRQTLSTLRDAIEIYALKHHGNFPGASNGRSSTFKRDLAPHLRREFPSSPVGPAAGNDQMSGRPLSGWESPRKAWKYDYTTGEFILNYNGISCDKVTRYDEF